MAIDRRALLRGVTGGLAGALAPAPLGARTGGALYLAARADAGGGYRASGFSARGTLAFDLPLPGRGHSFAVRPGAREAVLFARRPGRFALAIDLAGGSVAHRFSTPSDRHFQGHGAFGGDGRLLYASENDFDGERGVVGIYDAESGYRRVGELPSHGIGPHALATLPDGETLVVANGGILTRPDLPRIKLNLPTMAPSLCLIDRRDGRLLRELRLAPDLHRLSIRHLAVGAGGAVAVAMQYEGPGGALVPLVALHRRGGAAALRPLAAPAAMWRAMKHYCGGVCFDSSGRTIAVSAPRGHVVVFWDAGAGACLSSVRLADGCGVAPGGRADTFLASGGNGDVVTIDARSKVATPLAVDLPGRSRWDNHLVAAAAPRLPG